LRGRRANDVSRTAKRATVSGQDVLRALDDVEMPNLAEAAGDYLAAFKRASSKAAAASKSRKQAAAMANSNRGAADSTEDEGAS